MLVGERVPDGLAARLVDVAHTIEASAALADAARKLEPVVGATRQEHGPYYVFPGDVACECDAEIVTSAHDEARARLRDRNPGSWESQEWGPLLDGSLGPWTMALADEAVVSITHSPLPVSDRFAECGAWTHPDHRGRGYAAACTAAWARLVAAPGRHLFYSTTHDNLSSQRVAERLGLRHIGWTWNVDLVDMR